MDPIIKIFSPYQNNISKTIIDYQKKVFDKFNIDLIQEYTELSHPDYLDYKINEAGYDLIIFFDIDCIPLKADIVEYIINELSDNNSFIGVEQSNQKNPDFVFAGPACFAITKEVFTKIGKPSFGFKPNMDIASQFTISARKNNVNVKFFKIKSALNYKWRCGNKKFGNGTTYDDIVYHQFELGRYSKHPDLKILEYQFIKKCKKILDENNSINNN